MKIVALVQARMGSIRFSDKVIKKINGTPLIEILLKRLSESKKLHKLFEDGEEIVFYNDIVDCINKINYYTENSEERERIASLGYENVLGGHTQKQRVDFIIKKYKEWLTTRDKT